MLSLPIAITEGLVMKLIAATVLTVFLATPALAQATNPSNNAVTAPATPSTMPGANTATNVPTTVVRRDDDTNWGWLGLLGLAGLGGLMPRRARVQHVDAVNPGVNRTTTR